MIRSPGAWLFVLAIIVGGWRASGPANDPVRFWVWLALMVVVFTYVFRANRRAAMDEQSATGFRRRPVLTWTGYVTPEFPDTPSPDTGTPAEGTDSDHPGPEPSH